MAKQLPEIGDGHRDLISRQHIFFVASAAASSHVNLSPRSTDYFRILGPNMVAYLDRTGAVTKQRRTVAQADASQ